MSVLFDRGLDHDRQPRQGSRLNSFPVSSGQQRLWFLHQFESDKSVYNVRHAFRLSGSLEVPVLSRSLNFITQRHQSLHSSFHMLSGQLLQVNDPGVKALITVVDLRQEPESTRLERARRLAQNEAQRPFDLSRAPLLRVNLFQLSARDQILLFTFHHIILDEWSSQLFFNELSLAYLAFLDDRRPELAPLPVQYSDFVIKQQSEIRERRLETLLNFWRQKLSPPLPDLELPYDRPRPAKQTFRGAIHHRQIPQPTARRLIAIARESRMTLFMSLLAAFQLFLSRYTGLEDIVVGMPITNRGRLEWEGVIGFFLNTLVIRTDLSGNPSFRQLLTRVKEEALQVFSHQDLPFAQLVEEMLIDRDLSRTPLFQVMFVHKQETQVLPKFGIDATPFKLDTVTSKFDLTLFTGATIDGLNISFEYNTDLFDRSTIQSMSRNFQTLLENIAARPDARLSSIPILSEQERSQIVVEWNSTQVNYSDRSTVVHSFVAQARETPDSIAVVCGDRQLTYRDLDFQSGLVADRLIEKGVSPGKIIALPGERSLETMVGLLGILKAGGVCLPLDPDLPTGRLTYMLKDAQVDLAFKPLSVQDDGSKDIDVIDLNLQPASAPRYQRSFEADRVIPESPVYVLYTSGSTGKPKGVLMGHRTLYNLIEWQKDHSRAGHHTRTLHFAPLSFDVSFQEIFATWCTGGTLVIASNEIRRNPDRLLGYLNAQSIERLFIPFVVLQALANSAASFKLVPASLREVIVAGEPLQVTPAIVDLFSSLDGCMLCNHYGPTETLIVTTHMLSDKPEAWPHLPSIGRPISNTVAFVVDEKLRLVPRGVRGELLLGGHALAHNYLNRPGLTAERFIPDPFGIKPGGRLYRTGDLVRYLPDGRLEFIGRMDHQIKIRGFRVELGEIEALLLQYPDVKNALVVVHQREGSIGSEGAQLVAYLIPREEGALDIVELHAFIKERVPDYMIPVQFNLLEAFPLTSSGKVDRQALPSPEPSRSHLADEYVAPRTPLEMWLVKIWSELLVRPKIGVFDDFFDLGGHSLLVTRVVSRLRAAFQVEIPLISLFEFPTIAELAIFLQDLIDPANRLEPPDTGQNGSWEEIIL